MAGILLSSLGACSQPSWRELLQSWDPIERIRGTIQAGQATDQAAVPLLVDRLEDDDEAVRMYAVMALRRIEGTDLGYKYWADEVDRSRAAQRWRTYLKNKTAK